MRSNLFSIAVCVGTASLGSSTLASSSGSIEERRAPVTVTHTAMGTEFEFVLYARSGDESTDAVRHIAEEAFEAIDDLERRLSSWREDSETTYVNRHASENPVGASSDFLELVTAAKRYHSQTDGAFDCTIGPLIDLYGFRSGTALRPDARDVQRVLKRIGMDKVRVDAVAGTVAFDEKGMRLDFGAIGKGLAIDLAVERLRARGVTSALLHGGTSTVYALGAPPRTSGWTVHIRDPYNASERLDTVVLRDGSLSTSACYGVEDGGAGQPCDVLDPRSGRSVADTVSASAIAATATESDALSTAFLVMGAERTQEYCGDHKGVRAIIAYADGGGPAVKRIGF